VTTGHALATLRCRANLTATEVARLVGASVHVIKAVERDLVPWDHELGSRLLTALARESDLAILTLVHANDRVAGGGVVQGVPVVLQ
jgi:DNA-binding XRE family transcriptional regulator